MASEPTSPGLLDRFEYEGYWWAPSSPDHRVPGTLTYDPTNGLHLELLGHLTPLEEFGAYNTADAAVIYGFTKAGRAVTLDGSFSLTSQIRAPGIGTERFYSRAALIGEHVAEPENATFASCAFRFSNLEEWLSAKPFSFKVVSPRSPYALDVALRAPAEVTYWLEHLGAGLRTTSSFQTHGGMPRHFGVTVQSWLVLTPDCARTLPWYTDVIAKLRNLIALCFGAPVYIEGVTLNPDPSPGQDRPRTEVVYLQSPSPPSELTRLPLEWMRLSDFGHAAANVIDSWFMVYDVIEPALNLFFASLFGKRLYIDVRFLLLAQSMEVLHRFKYGSLYVSQQRYDEIRSQIEDAIPSDVPIQLREKLSGVLQWGNEYSLRRRLTELDSRPLTKMGIGMMGKHKRNKMVDTKNYYTHYSSQLKNKAAHGQEMQDLIQLMTAAMIAILFEMLDVEPEQVRNRLKRSSRFGEFVH